jgi:hypothetical protein
MHLLRLLWVAFFVAAASAAFAQVNVEFAGVLVTPEKTSLQLTNLSNGRTAWIPLGQTFAGFTVSSYDKKTETATLTKDGVPTLLRLKSAKIQEAKTLTPEQQAAIQKAVLNNLRQIGAAADQYYLEHGKNNTTLEELVGPEKYIKALNPVDGEDYGTLELKQGKELKVTTASGVTVALQQ